MTTSKARRKAKVERIECCMKHLESKGFGCCIGKGRNMVFTSCYEPREGTWTRCKTCGKRWEFVIDEAEGSAWEQMLVRVRRGGK